MELSVEFKDIERIVEDYPLMVAGPCSAETEEQIMDTAKRLSRIGVKVMRAGIWKPRTRPGGFEGIGEKGLAWMKEAKEETGMKIMTEVGCPAHVEACLRAGVDMLWVGARTACNPFSVQAIADSLRGVDIPVWIKNPLSPDLKLWIGAFERMHNAGVRKLGAIHRGFYSREEHKYRNTPGWEVSDELRQYIPDMPFLFDPSHIGGKREYIYSLSEMAMKKGFDGLMVESHCNPDGAWTDAAQQVTPEQLKDIMDALGMFHLNSRGQ